MKQAVPQEWHGGQRNQADLPVEGEHDGEHPADRHGIGRELQDGVRKHVLQGVRIPGDLGQQVARPRAVVERERQRLQMREQLAAQGVDHLVADGRGDEYLGVGEHPSGERDQHDGASRLHEQRDFPPRGEVLEKTQGMRKGLVQDHVIEDDLEGPRLQQLRRGGAHGARGGEEQTPFDAAQVRHEQLTESRPFAVRRHGTPGAPPGRARRVGRRAPATGSAAAGARCRSCARA